MDFETRAIHDGQEPDPATGAVITPIYQTSTFAQDAVGENKGYDYSRAGNPTRTALETCLASLERADHGLAYSSGLGATTTIMHLLGPGDRVLCVNDVYGGVYRMFSQVYEPKGYRFEYLSAEQIDDGLEEHLDERRRLVWLETPTNPLLNVIDIRAAADAAHAVGALVVVDNTFATPYLQRPLELGADIVVHSTTKYLGGHSDVIGGFAATNDPTIAERSFLQKSLGAVPARSTRWLVLRGLKTLAIRMRQHCENARAIAAFLNGHAAVEQRPLPRPARPSRGTRSRAADARLRRDDLLPRRERGGGGRAGRAHEGLEARREPRRRREPDRAPGAHDARFDRRRAVRRAGEPVRLSVGIESADDLVADLEQALAAVGSGTRGLARAPRPGTRRSVRPGADPPDPSGRYEHDRALLVDREPPSVGRPVREPLQPLRVAAKVTGSATFGLDDETSKSAFRSRSRAGARSHRAAGARRAGRDACRPATTAGTCRSRGSSAAGGRRAAPRRRRRRRSTGSPRQARSRRRTRRRPAASPSGDQAGYSPQISVRRRTPEPSGAMTKDPQLAFTIGGEGDSLTVGRPRRRPVVRRVLLSRSSRSRSVRPRTTEISSSTFTPCGESR